MGDPALAYGDVAATAPADTILEDRVTEGPQVALETEALSAGPQQVVDALFETGWYQNWQDMRQETQLLRGRSATNRQRFEAVGATRQLAWDERALGSIARDFDEVMTRAASGQPVDVAAARRLYAVYTLAIGVVTQDNDALDAAFAAGLVAAFVAFPFALFRIRALGLQELLKDLKKRLEIAKKELDEAWVQTLLDAALTGITLFTGVGLIARGGIMVAQGLIDNALGPSTSTAATVGSSASKAAEFASAIDEVRAATVKEKVVAKAGGATASVVGFAFNINELGVGYKNVDKLRAAMDRATSALKKLNSEIDKHLPALQRFVQQYQRWQASIADLRANADLARQALEQDLKLAGYNVR
jgi:hypothetical protein